MKDITTTKAHEDFLEAGFVFSKDGIHILYKKEYLEIEFQLEFKYYIVEYLRDSTILGMKTHTLIHNMLVELGWL